MKASLPLSRFYERFATQRSDLSGVNVSEELIADRKEEAKSDALHIRSNLDNAQSCR
jgi:hypothetical protein